MRTSYIINLSSRGHIKHHIIIILFLRYQKISECVTVKCVIQPSCSLKRTVTSLRIEYKLYITNVCTDTLIWHGSFRYHIDTTLYNIDTTLYNIVQHCYNINATFQRYRQCWTGIINFSSHHVDFSSSRLCRSYSQILTSLSRSISQMRLWGNEPAVITFWRASRLLCGFLRGSDAC